MAVVLAALLGLALPGLPFAPAPAGAAPLPMDLDLVSGSLQLRDTDEPASLTTPTTFEATIDDATGQVTGGNLSVAPLSFQFDITEPIAATVYVDAVFTQLTPGSATGKVEPVTATTAEVELAVDVEVDLHIEVGKPAFLLSDCTATPISLRLSSTVPYEDRETDTVTLTDADFAVPPVTSGGPCVSIIADGVNERLAGGGHSIELEMTGTIPKIRIGTHATTTTLQVAPSTSRQGDEVTLTAQVTPGPNPPAAPVIGLVEFRDGDTSLGTAPVDGTGKATVTTTALEVGTRHLVAEFKGDEEYRPSTSDPVGHLVAAAPVVSWPQGVAPIIIGSNPRPVTVTISNPAAGAPITGGRLQVDIGRVGSTNTFLTQDQFKVEWHDGTAWQPLATTAPTIRSLRGFVEGLSIPVGGQVPVQLRFQAFSPGTTPSPTACGPTNPTCPGPLLLAGTLDEGAGTDVLATGEAPVNLIETSRRPTTMAFPGGGFPRPHTIRQGHSLLFSTTLAANFGGVPWSGTAEAYIDGVQVPMRSASMPFEAGYTDQLAVGGSTVAGWILLPQDMETGNHLLTVRYGGDAFHGPGEITSQFHVYASVPGAQHLVCREPSLTSMFEWGASLVFDADLPATALAGAEVDFSADDVRLLMHRTSATGLLIFAPNNATTAVGERGLESITFNFGGAGSATATALTRTGGAALAGSPPAPEADVDQTYAFTGTAGTATLTGQPGDVVPLELQALTISYRESLLGLPFSATCTPRGGPMVVGETEIAGTSVSVSPGRVREGTDVVDIEARTFPADAAGTVTFSSDLDGTLGTDVVSGGVASWSEGGLRPGRHVITASFDASDPGVPDSSGSAEVVVSYSPRSATEAFVVAARTDYLGSADREGVVADAAALDGGLSRVAYLRQLARSDAYLARVVEGLYQDTLGRPADDAGKTFWIGRLRAGWSVAQVTASFYGSGEYFAKAGGGTVETWIDDLYLKLLGRASDADGRAHWVRETGRIGRGTVAFRFFQTRESARSRVIALYDLFLDRTPSRADQDFWATRVIAQGDLALAVELTLSGEYGRRAGNRYPQI